MDSGAVAVLYAAEQKSLVDPLRQQFPNIRWLAADEGDYAAAVAAAATAEPPIGATGTDPLYMMYTSGTTGRPKGALMSHAANIAWLASMLATSDLRHGERNIIVAPLFHIGGLGLAMSAVYRGMTTVLLKQFDPGVMWDLVDAEKITGFFAVPAMLALMYQHPKRTTTARSALRWVICGAAPVPVTLIEAYLAMGVEILQVYGLTETHGGICLMSPEHARTKVGSTGMPYFGIDVRVVDKAGTPVPPGIPGEVVTRGPHLISGYWNRPDATQEAIREGWFHTGDIAEVDAEGFIYIKDRSKDMVITGGENVYPAEVEDVLGGHAGVREVGVIGQPSPKWGESVCAVIVRGDDWKGDDELLVQELRTLVQIAAGALQAAEDVRLHERAAAQPVRQDPQAHAARAVSRPRVRSDAPRLWPVRPAPILQACLTRTAPCSPPASRRSPPCCSLPQPPRRPPIPARH